MAVRCAALAGFAGTGKTTCVSELLDKFPKTAVCAPTGKAAGRLRELGCPGATTIHGLIYNCEKQNGKMVWRKQRCLPNVNTIVVDEGSMVNHQLHADLCSFGLPVLYVGDHGQLEPIGDNPNLMQRPDVKLEKIHRQAENNPIIRLARAFREGRPVPYWRDEQGRCAIVPAREFPKHIMSGAQIIVGTNKTRHAINAQIRAQHGYTSALSPGDRIICLENNREFGMFNGQQAVVRSVSGRGEVLDLALDLGDGEELHCLARRSQFGKNKIEESHRSKALLLDYAYAVTAHKMQGSEADSVLVLEEICSAWDARRWRYTCASRAREKLIWCR